MGMSCGMSFVKYVLFIFNLICAIGGIALVVIGGITISKLGELKDLFEDGQQPAIVPGVIIILGAVVFIIAFFGCCGAIRESQCLMTFYTLFLLILVIGQIVIAAFVFVYNDDVVKATGKGFDRLWQSRDSSVSSKAIDQIQRNLQCCGKNSFLDYGISVPASCCDSETQLCNTFTSYKQGCSSKIKEFTQNSATTIAYASLALGLVELLGVIFGCCLCNSFRSRRYD